MKRRMIEEIDNTDFYLTSDDSTHFAGMRKCRLEGLVRGTEREDYLLVRVDPPVIDPDDASQLIHFLLAGRYDHFTSVTKREPVYILKILSQEVFMTRRCSQQTAKMVAWGQVIPRDKTTTT